MASGPHSALLAMTRTTFQVYAARHGFDLVVPPHDDDDTSRSFSATPYEPKSAAADRWYLRQGRKTVRWLREMVLWLAERMPPSRKFRGIAPPGSLRARAMDGFSEAGLRTFARCLPIATPPAWRKIALIRELLARYDLVVWIDADAVFVDPTVDISTELIPEKWLYAVEHHTNEGAHLNTGVVMVRSCTEADEFLRDVAMQKHYMLHRWWDQAAVLYLLGYTLCPVERSRVSRYYGGLSLLDKRWNSIPPDRADTPYLIHFAGVSHERRMELIRERVSAFNEKYVSFPSDGSARG